MTTAIRPETKQHIVTPFEVKGIDSEQRTFEGYSATWDLDQGNDVILKGAFARTLEHFARGTKIIPLIDSHDYSSIKSAVGKLVEAREDERGLWTKWSVIKGADGEGVLDRLRGGVISKMSIGYRPVRFDFTEMETATGKIVVRQLHEVKLEESSLVLFPMNEAADVNLSSVKALIEAASDEAKAALRALLTDAPPPEAAAEVKGLAPDDPARIALEATVRDLTLRSLATRTPAARHA